MEKSLLVMLLVMAAAVMGVLGCDNESDSNTGEGDTDTDIDIDTDSDTDADTDTGIDTGTEGDSDTGADTETDTDDEPDEDVGDEPDEDVGDACNIPAPVINYFVPSGWMGDMDTMSLDDKCDVDRPEGARGSCNMVEIDPSKSDGTGWVGVFWQRPPNSWEFSLGPGCDLRAATSITFQAMGAVGGEVVNFFGAGSMDQAITLTDTWTEYTIDLSGVLGTENVWGGFGYSLKIDQNLDGEGGSDVIVFYIDDIFINVR